MDWGLEAAVLTGVQGRPGRGPVLKRFLAFNT